MRKILIIAFVLILPKVILSQEQGKIRAGLNGGLLTPNLGVGIGGDLDFRYNFSNNLNAGVRVGFGSMVKDVIISSDNSTMSSTISYNSSVLIIGDYYFNTGNSTFAPFMGAGLGNYNITNIHGEVDNGDKLEINASAGNINTLGAVIRTGFELGKLRMSLEYNLIPRTTMYDILLNNIGKANNNYLSINIGFYLGGGKWRK